MINMSYIKTSVVVIAKNEERFIGKCLKALKNQSRKCEIIVVDGHSKDRTRKIAEKFADKIVLDNKKGVSDARNVGARAATGYIIAYCDADSVPERNWVETVQRRMKGKIGVYGPIVLYDGSKKTRLSLKLLNRLVQFFHNLGKPCICGANMAFRREVLIKHKFDEKLSILEDYEIGNRLKKYGKIGYFRDLVMPISSRRYENNVFYAIFFYYIRNFYRLSRGKKIKPGSYWIQLDKIKK